MYCISVLVAFSVTITLTCYIVNKEVVRLNDSTILKLQDDELKLNS